jgi:hypothetical protein
MSNEERDTCPLCVDLPEALRAERKVRKLIAIAALYLWSPAILSSDCFKALHCPFYKCQPSSLSHFLMPIPKFGELKTHPFYF